MEIDNITREEIKDLDYSRLVGMLKERNKPSGGLKSIVEVSRICNLEKNSKILEIGSNTGFTSVNLSLLNKNLIIYGIDINQDSIIEAKKFAKLNLVSERVFFDLQDSENLNFPDKYFKLVWCSNVTSFIKNKQKAISEYIRVLDFEGYLVLIPIYYLKEPPKSLLDKVSSAINSKVEHLTKKDWTNLFHKVCSNLENSYLEIIFEKDFMYERQDDKRINDYCIEVLKKSKLDISKKIHKEIFNKYKEYLKLFNKNLQYCGYSIIIFQKRRFKDESELFLSREVSLNER